MPQNDGNAGGGRALYVHRPAITFGHTDSAGIVYTVRFFDYGIEAIEGWFREILGLSWHEINIKHHMGTPFVHVDMDMRSPLVPGDDLAVTVRIKEAGRSSLRFALSGHKGDGILSFEGEWVCVVVDTETMKSMSLPEPYAGRLRDYLALCEGAASGVGS